MQIPLQGAGFPLLQIEPGFVIACIGLGGLGCVVTYRKKFAIGCGVLVVLGIVVLAVIAICGIQLQSPRQVATGCEQPVGPGAKCLPAPGADLVPNLVATVSGAANFEKSTLVDIAQARASVGQVKIDPNNAPADPAKLAEFEKAQGALSSALSRLLVVSEQYPDLKANANFVDLQAQLEGTENRITVERGNFNTAVQSYNTAIKSFPTFLYAGAYGFTEKPYFTATAGSETPPAVKFDFNNK